MVVGDHFTSYNPTSTKKVPSSTVDMRSLYRPHTLDLQSRNAKHFRRESELCREYKPLYGLKEILYKVGLRFCRYSAISPLHTRSIGTKN